LGGAQKENLRVNNSSLPIVSAGFVQRQIDAGEAYQRKLS